MNQTTTVRKLLLTEVQDLLDEEGLQCTDTSQTVTELLALLAHYSEEQHRLFPKVIICNRVSEIRGVLGGVDEIPIGEGDISPGTMRQALKSCAPLAGLNWLLYLERGYGKMRYGLLRSGLLPTAIDPKASLHESDVDALLISRVGAGTVEAVGAHGNRYRVVFSAAKEIAVSASDHVDTLTSVMVRGLAAEEAETTASFFRSVLNSVVEVAHGTLIAVCCHSYRCLGKDAIFFDPEINFSGFAVRASTPTSNGGDVASAMSYAELLRGMLSSEAFAYSISRAIFWVMLLCEIRTCRAGSRWG